MPRQARIQSPQRQRIAATLLMAAVFLASLGLAALVGRAGQAATRAPAFAMQRVSLNGLTFEVPAQWSRQSAGSAVTFSDPDAPRRTLTLTTLMTDRAAAPAQVRARLLDETFGLRAPPGLYDMRQSPNNLQLAEWISVPQPADAGHTLRVHMLAALTLDGRRYWSIHLTDRVPADIDAQAAISETWQLLRHIERSAAPEETFE
ncbi:MAG: hypothetical protein ACODAQ_09710 [Phycisphaeraceae bacterium]